MNFQELVAATVVETNRPDLGFVSANGDGQIPNTVFAAISTLHMMDGSFFYKDIISATLNFPYSNYIQMLETDSLARYRAIAYIRKWDPAYNAYQLKPTALPPSSGGYNINRALAPITIVDPEAILDPYFGNERTDIAYSAGNRIYIKSSTPLPAVQIGWYSYPFLDASNNGAGLESWIANEVPYAIVYWAASKIFSVTGYNEQSRKYDQPNTGLVAQQMRIITAIGATAQGR